MERKISLSDLKKAVDEAYELFKSDREGAVDSRLDGVDADAFGISVALTDGRTVDKADTDTLFAMGSIAKVPLSAVLLSQNKPEELVKKSGTCQCHRKAKPEIPFSAHGIRAVSAVVPAGDPEGKYDVVSDMIIGMAGEPTLNDSLYQTFQTEAATAGVVDKIAESGYYLYDDAAASVKAYTKLMSLQFNTKQLANMGATIAADGRNPRTGIYAFDGKNAAAIVTLMAAGKMKHCRRGWLMRTGLPARASFAGGILAVLPGFGAIAVYAPRLDERGLSVKGAKAIEYIATKLGLNVFASARVVVE